MIRRAVMAGDLKGVLQHLAKTKQKFDLPPDAGVVTVYEAGRDGFWLHRWLVDQGFTSLIVDAASIKVERRKRRVKTDRLDANELVSLLMRHSSGEQKVWSVLQIPSRQDEDLRRLQRQMGRLKVDQGRQMTRIRSVLVTYGISLAPEQAVKELRTLRSPSGERLGEHAQGEIRREWKSAEVIARNIKQIEREREKLEAKLGPKEFSKTLWVVGILVSLKGIGPEAAWTLATEMFGWREFKNRKQVGSAAGLCGSHYASGNSDHDQGISKAGNPRVRSLMVEVAWLWLRYQPESPLTKWFFANSKTKRQRRVHIVALARLLLVALHRWVKFAEVPPKAALSSRLSAHAHRALELGWCVPGGSKGLVAA